jgi:hypothetical protein
MYANLPHATGDRHGRLLHRDVQCNAQFANQYIHVKRPRVPIDLVNGYGTAVRTLAHKRTTRLNDLTALQLAIRAH